MQNHQNHEHGCCDSHKETVDNKIEQTLLKLRRIYIGDGIDPDSAKDAIRKLWFLEAQNPGRPILVVINSPGGSIDSGYAIWDTIHMITSPVSTLVTGLAASMGSILSLACSKGGKRYATPNSRIMIHQPRINGVIKGQATDLAIQAAEITKTRNGLIKVYQKATGKDFATLEKALDRDSWMSTEEALEYGLLDKIVKDFSEIPM